MHRYRFGVSVGGEFVNMGIYTDQALANNMKEKYDQEFGTEGYGICNFVCRYRRVTNGESNENMKEKCKREVVSTSETLITPKKRVRSYSNPVAENLLNRNFTVTAPNMVWVSDITYIRNRDGKFEYYTTVIDLFDRSVIGSSLSSDMSYESTVMAAFEDAIRRSSLCRSGIRACRLVFHSDRGSQYTCKEFVKLLSEYNITQSNSRKGNCWDNAVAESFFKTQR